MFKTESMVSYTIGNNDAPAGGQPGPSTFSGPSTFAGTQPTTAPPIYMTPFPYMPFSPAGGQPRPSTFSGPSMSAGTQPTNAPPLFMPPFPYMPFWPGFLPNALPGVIPFIMPPVPPQQQQPAPQVAHLANAPQSQQASDGVCKEKRSESWTLRTSKTESTERADLINNFSESPSLQRIAVVSIAIGLWTLPDIRNEMAYYFLHADIENAVKLKRRILDKLSNSSLPSSLKTEISYVIRPIMLQLWKALRSYGRLTGYQENLREYYIKHGTIYWTVEGTVDIVKSFTEIFDNGNLDSGQIACSHCLGEYATNLWEKIPEELRNQFRIALAMYDYDLIIYWTCVLENNLGSFLTRLIDHDEIYDDKLSIDVNMIACSIQIGNIVALKYFWKKLSEQEKNDHLSKWLLQATQQCMEFENDSFYQYSSEFFDVLYFLLSHVNRITQMTEFFRNHSHVLVFLFESWPYQRIFLSTIFELLDDLQEDIYSSIMRNISSKMSKRGNEMIFKEIWSASPLRLRRSFLKNKSLCYEVLLHLLQLENLNMAVRILNDVSEEEIKLYICFMFFRPEFTRAIYSNNLNSLHMLLSKSTLPPECYPYKRNVLEQKELDRLMKSWFIGYGDWHIFAEWIYEGNIQAAASFFRWAYQSVSIETLIHFLTLKLNIET
ncbi:uncharacterized protein [Parasteatoda tepidariorum]|uniref:uncharacterized protein isoform X2 n=1 Tax=Parasteatoda tepidariorum TaxID=114398 RepID=UPI001C723448|nr:uncharacterized protein LOC107443319 isoform X3 [Parasteatoda tepidariorum]